MKTYTLSEAEQIIEELENKVDKIQDKIIELEKNIKQ